MFKILKVYITKFFLFPQYIMYHTYDKLMYWYFCMSKEFFGWGIHLYVGLFGAGKSCFAVSDVYAMCLKYPQLHVLTNIKLTNFPEHTRILRLETAQDILNAPRNTVVLIDEIGSIFNSRDFSSGKTAVPKVLYQHLTQCRKRKIMILGTVQRYNLLDKQIRDVTADVTACVSSPAHPFTRYMTAYKYDIDEYEMYQQNRTYAPRIENTRTKIQRELFRNLYDTEELVQGMLKKEYLSDAEILQNRDDIPSNALPLDRKGQIKIRHRKQV